jgi:hypothetical protein
MVAFPQFHGNGFTERSLTARFLVRPKAALRAALDARRRRRKTTQPTKHRHNNSRKNVGIAHLFRW